MRVKEVVKLTLLAANSARTKCSNPRLSRHFRISVLGPLDSNAAVWGLLNAMLSRSLAAQSGAPAPPREITITRWNRRWGSRLGNHLQMLRTAAQAATLLGCDLHVAEMKREFKNRGQPRIFKAPDGSRCEYRPEIALLYNHDSDVWWDMWKKGPAYAAFLSQVLEVKESERTSGIMNGVLGHNETHAGGLPCSKYRFDVAMHIRAGDIMRGKYAKDGGWQPSWFVSPMYGQPPLSFYVDCLEHNLRPGQRAVAVMEDLSNPVAPVLQMMAEHQTVWNLTVVQLPVLNEAVATLGCAPIVCNARGSFHGSYVNTFHTRKSVDASDEKIRGAYGKIWKNTAKQRAAMLHSRRR